jgi:PIN domain nuclease of toxin-antitoxin system
VKLLLDTHAFLWMDARSARIPAAVAQAVKDPTNDVFLSVASLWELQIKVSIGKLHLDRSLQEIVRDQRSVGLRILPIKLRHVYALDGLPGHHRDPFDRLLVAQAIRDGLTLVTADPQIARYSVPTLW